MKQNSKFPLLINYTGVTVQLKMALLQLPSWGKMCAKEGASSCSASVSPHGWHTASEKLSACWHTHIHTLTLTLYPQQVSPTEGWRRQTSVSFLFFSAIVWRAQAFGPQRVQNTGAWSHVSGPARPFLWASHWGWIEPGRGCQGGLRQEAGGEEVASGRPGRRPMGKPNRLSPGLECGKSGWKLAKRSEARVDGRMPGQCGAYGGYSTSRVQEEGSCCASACPKFTPSLSLHSLALSLALAQHSRWQFRVEVSYRYTRTRTGYG